MEQSEEATAKVLQFKPNIPETDDVQRRLARIRESIGRINKLIAELREMQK